MDPQQVEDWLKEHRVPAKKFVAPDGLSRIQTELTGRAFLITFHPLVEDGSSRDQFRFISFFAAFKKYPWSIDRVNEWNANQRFLRAYIEGGDLCGQMDVMIASDALDTVLLRRNLQAWELALDEFARQLNAK